MDTVELYRRTTQEWITRVRRINVDDWNARTPCTEWNVRALVNHVVSEQRWLPPLMGGATIAEVGNRFDGDLLGDDPGTIAAEAAAEALAAVPDAVAEKRIVHLSFGDTLAADYARGVAADQLVHAWDLAAAIGDDRQFDPELVVAVAEWFVSNEEPYRAAGEIAPRPDVPGDDPQTLLLVAFGRNPMWPSTVEAAAQ